MAAKEKLWSTESLSQTLREFIDSPSSEFDSTEKIDPLTEGFRDSAAVLSSFNPTTLKPFGVGSAGPGDFAVILPDSDPVAGAGSKGDWTLRSDIRSQTLRTLARSGSLRQVVMETPAPTDDHFNQALHKIWSKEGFNLSSMSEEELAATYSIAKEVGKFQTGIPSTQEISQTLGKKRLLAPFLHLANPDHFRGRKRELEILRNYVGVSNPKTTSGSIFRHVREFFGFEKRPPLMIFGPGGMGKSALISHFILEHAELDTKRRFPFAYIDFDRPMVSAKEPLSIISEILFQVGIQYPTVAESCEELRSELSPHLSWAFRDPEPEQEAFSNTLETTQYVRNVSSSDYERGHFVESLSKVFEVIASKNQPLLLVLDTFEEVQHYSRADIPELFSFLEQVQRILPRLRVVLSGRTRETSTKLEPIALAQLEADEATAVLRSFGVSNKEAKLMSAKLGGNPLTLRLAADVYKKEGLSEKALSSLVLPRKIWHRIDQERIQGELYKRFLGHIKDDKVRKIAHPGLVLRRVTPDLIFKVLQEPCELSLDTPGDARRLFEKMALEDTLVSWEGSAIVHRSDIRRIMIDLLGQDKPAQVRTIHTKAVSYYQHFGDLASRAEEIYHRYCLGQETEAIDVRWIEGVEERLRTAIEEIPEDLRPHLASRLGIETADDEYWQAAKIEDWEHFVAGKARQLISHARFEEALKLMKQRPRSAWSSASTLFNLEILALAQLGDLEQAERLGIQALERVQVLENKQQELEILASLGSIARRSGALGNGIERLLNASMIAEKLNEPIRAIDLLVLALETQDWEDQWRTDSELKLQCQERLVRLLDGIGVHQIVHSPVLFTRVANEILGFQPERARKLMDLVSAEASTSLFSVTSERPMRKWNVKSLKALNNELLDVIKDSQRLERILEVYLDLPLREVSRGGSYKSIVFETITYLNRIGRLDEFVSALQTEFPNRTSLFHIGNDDLENG